MARRNDIRSDTRSDVGFSIVCRNFHVIFFFRFLMKTMTELNELLSEMFSDDSVEEVSERGFLIGEVKNEESISNSKTPWTEERLRKASDKVIDKLYEKCVNPPSIKIDEREALEMGKPVCLIVIEIYAESLNSLTDQIPYIKERYTVNTGKLKANILANKLFCENLAIKIVSKLLEQVGGNSASRVGASLAAMTWDAVEKIEMVADPSNEPLYEEREE